MSREKELRATLQDCLDYIGQAMSKDESVRNHGDHVGALRACRHRIKDGLDLPPDPLTEAKKAVVDIAIKIADDGALLTKSFPNRIVELRYALARLAALEKAQVKR